MEKKNSKGIVIVIILLILIILELIGYICYAKGFIKDNVEIEEKTATKEVTNEENLDINSNLVEYLYAKVSHPSTNGSCVAEWFFNDSNNQSKDLTVDNMTEKQKMNLVGLNLNASKEQYIECDSSIPDNSGYYMSICSAYKNGNINETGYTKKYVESVYKSLYGENASMTTESIIMPNSIYIYNESKDMYIKYISESGSLIGTTCAPITYKLELEKATKKNDSIILYEKKTETNQEYESNGVTYPASSKTSTNVYTFKLDSDGIYRFISKKNTD